MTEETSAAMFLVCKEPNSGSADSLTSVADIAGWLVDGRLDLSAGAAFQLTHQSFAPRKILLLFSIVVANLTCLKDIYLCYLHT